MKIEYFLLLIICLIVPLIYSFSKKLDFYKYPKRIIYSIGLPFLIFLLWDIFAAYRGHWSFNQNYIIGFQLFGLPIEEILFFIIIPFCALFTWESVKYFTSKIKQNKI